MKIQIISQGEHKVINGCENNSFVNAKSCDEYDLNIINMNTPEFWRTNGCGLVIQNIFDKLMEVVERSSTGILFVLPTNQRLENIYDTFHVSDEEDLLSVFDDPVRMIIKESGFDETELISAKTKTVVNGVEYVSSFHFDTTPYEKIGFSIANQCVVIKNHNKLLTTLPILDSENQLMAFIEFYFSSENADKPEWLDDTHCLGDDLIIELIQKYQDVIKNTNEEIKQLENKLETINHYKMILYSKSTVLENIVREIIGELTNCDLSSFKDKHRYDFIIKKENVTFIGEIKGFTSNVRNAHVSKLIYHCDRYHDDESGDDEIIKGLLIVNTHIDLPPSKRECIKNEQIEYASKNNILIVTTPSLLKIFDRYKSNLIDSDKIVSLLSNETGELKFE